MKMNLFCPILLVNVICLLLNIMLLWSTEQMAPPLVTSQSSNTAFSGTILAPRSLRNSSTEQNSTLARKNKVAPSLLPHPVVRESTPTDEQLRVKGESTASPRQPYRIPDIQHTTLVNCSALLENDFRELAKAQQVMKKKAKVPIYEETYLEWTRDCLAFRRRRGYIEMPLSSEEEDFPIAFSISMYSDVEQAERLLRAIYQPQNIYCIHVDIKASLLLHRAVAAIANCFHNVFIASHLEKVKWGDVSVLLPALTCMGDLVKHHWGKWNYFVNLAGQEFPLRTNYELVKIAKIFNGSNDISGSAKRMEMDRVNHYWTHRWSKTYQQTIFYDTMQLKPRPNFLFNLTFYKGELHGFFSRNMVRYIVTNDTARRYLAWCWDTGHASEHYWNVLNYNVQFKAPGGYEGPMNLAEEYSYHPAIRAKHWQDENYLPRDCQGKVVRGICVYGVGDLPWLGHRKEMIANKFYLTYQYLALDCMEEQHRNRTKMGKRVPFPEDYYRKLPTVLYGRKDGLL